MAYLRYFSDLHEYRNGAQEWDLSVTECALVISVVVIGSISCLGVLASFHLRSNGRSKAMKYAPSLVYLQTLEFNFINVLL